MPKVNMDYSKTIIYKIVCNDITITDCYVGRTTNFTKRKWDHHSSCSRIKNKKYNLYVYQYIREHGDWINWNMIEIEKYSAIDKLDAGKRERYWIEKLNSTLNKTIPTRTKEEYFVENKEIILEKQKIYYEQNKNIILEKQKIYYEQNKEHVSNQHKLNEEYIKTYMDQWREINKEQIIEYRKNYYELNKEKIALRRKQIRLNKKLQNQQQDGNA